MAYLGIAEKTETSKGKLKLNYNGYLYVKERNRESWFSWVCEDRKSRHCLGRLTTRLIASEHNVIKENVHSHSASASRIGVCDFSAKIKARACNTRENPVTVIQSVRRSEGQDTLACLPSEKALIKQVKRARRADFPPEPNNFRNFVINDNYLNTLDGVRFTHDFLHENFRFIIFFNQNNAVHLWNANYWLMDGTFKTVPSIFQQLYTIHCEVGGQNSRILGLHWFIY